MRKYITIISTYLFVCMLHFSCSQKSPVMAGDVTETGNAKVMGKIVNSDAIPVSGTQVQLIPQLYNPVSDPAIHDSLTDTTDENGAYEIDVADSGTYNIQAVHPFDATMFLIQNVELKLNDSVIVPDDTLKLPGTIIITLPDSLLTEDAYLYVPGTNIKKQLDSASIADRQIVMDSVPAGAILPVYYIDSASRENPVNVKDTVEAIPQDTVFATLRKKYRVSVAGDDANDGVTSPFRTITKGCSVVQAGDTLEIASGEYDNEFDIKIINSGSKSAPIIITAKETGKVVLKGSRQPEEIDGGGVCFALYGVSYITMDGLHIRDYNVGIDVVEGTNHIFQKCILESNGSTGIQNLRNNDLIVKDCQFIDPNPSFAADSGMENAIQNCGVSFYHCANILVENCCFWGNHNEACSFKEGCHNGIVRNCIFEGALYTAIYLGENMRADGKPKCTNLTAEYNIVRKPAGAYRIKSPIRVDNVENATVRYNYCEGWDETDNTCAINILSEALGVIEVYKNILAYSEKNENSGGVYLSAKDATVRVYNNTMYDIVQPFSFGSTEVYYFKNNLIFNCQKGSVMDSSSFNGDPAFVGSLTQLPLSIAPEAQDFDVYYGTLTNPFKLSNQSPVIDKGVDVGLPYNGSAPDVGACESE